MQTVLFNIEEIKRDVLFINHIPFYLQNTLWSDIYIAKSKHHEIKDYVVVRKENFKYNDTYPIINSFKSIT